jgi:hypothetical protein
MLKYFPHDVKEYPTGMHKAIVKDSQIVMYEKNGERAMKIVVPFTLSYYEQIALEELTEFLKLSTGHDFEIVAETGLTLNENDK